jgi:uncharacterized integral membrane protein
MSKRKRSGRRRFPYLIPLQAAFRRRKPSAAPKRMLGGRSGNHIYQEMVRSGVRWVLFLAFVILFLIAVEEISVVVFGREPHRTFTPSLISALTAIVGGVLFFFRQIIRYHRNNHLRDPEREDGSSDE